jgi:hypothetical protein
MTIQESIDFVNERSISGSNYMDYEAHAKKLADEIVRLKGVINNTTHGRRKIESDVREEVDVRNRDWIMMNGERFHVTDDLEELTWERRIHIDNARLLIEKGKAMRIPDTMHYGDNYIYKKLSTGHLACFSKHRLDKDDGSFFDTINIWIPQPDKGKYVQLGIVCQGKDRWGDRVRFNTNHYKGESSFTHYTSKNLARAGIYKDYVVEALKIYRELSDNSDFLKDVKI